VMANHALYDQHIAPLVEAHTVRCPYCWILFSNV
jgi:hypothetical protein